MNGLNASFGAVLDSLRREGESWAVTIPKAGSNGRTVFGGLQVALSVRATRGALGASLGDGNGNVVALPLRSLQTTFVAPVPAGTRVELRAEFLQQLQLRWGAGKVPYSGHGEPRSTIFARLRDPDCTAEDALIALADSIPTPGLSMQDKPAPATSINWMLELIGDPNLLERDQWSMIGTDVRAGADGDLGQTSVLWGSGGHGFSVSHQSVAIFG